MTEPYKVSDGVKCYEYQKRILQIWKFHAFLDRGPDPVPHNGTTIALVQFCDPRATIVPVVLQRRQCLVHLGPHGIPYTDF